MQIRTSTEKVNELQTSLAESSKMATDDIQKILQTVTQHTTELVNVMQPTQMINTSQHESVQTVIGSILYLYISA